MIIPFDKVDSGDRELVGGKAWNLALMTKASLAVPAGWVIKATAFTAFLAQNGIRIDDWQQRIIATPEAQLEDILAPMRTEIISKKLAPDFISEAWDIVCELKSSNYTAVALRSSGNFEDAANASFAGQFETLLNIKTKEELAAGIKSCWAALFHERVVTYCLRQGIPFAKLKLALVIQGLIPADCAGVAFTVDPLKGNDKCIIIESLKGLGEALVQGVVTPDTYHYDWYKEEAVLFSKGEQARGLFPAENGGIEWRETDKTPSLEPTQVAVLATLALQVQEIYGTPQDIEWALYQGQFYLLQSRPITSIRVQTDQDWTNADFKDGGVSSTITTPYMWSLYKSVFDTTMPTFLRRSHIYPDYEPASWSDSFMGTPYWNLGAVKNGAMNIPGFIERQFDEGLGIEPHYEGNGHTTAFTPLSLIRGLRILWSTNQSIKKRPAKCKTAIALTEQIVADYYQLDLRGLSDEELLNYYRDILRIHYPTIECAYFYTIYDNSNATTFFQEALEKYNDKHAEKLNGLKLISGLRDLSHMRPINELWAIRDQIVASPEAQAFYEQIDIAQLEKLVLEKAEFPFAELLRTYLSKHQHKSARELDILVPHWLEEPKQVLHSLLNFIHNERVQSPLVVNEKQHEHYEEELTKIRSQSLRKKLAVHRKMLWWREEMRDCSTKMYHIIRQVALEAGRRLQGQGIINDPEDIFFLTYEESLQLCSGEHTSELQQLITKNRRFYKCFRNYQPPNEIWSSQAKHSQVSSIQSAHELSGIPCSNGVVTGEVSVIKSIFEIDDLKPQSILVTRFTDPAWTSSFPMISGLITETGGMLSHGAVVSREYGIPAILAVKGATTVLKSGMVVEINGDTGTIKVIE